MFLDIFHQLQLINTLVLKTLFLNPRSCENGKNKENLHKSSECRQQPWFPRQNPSENQPAKRTK